MIPKALREYALKYNLSIRREKFADGTIYTYLVDGKPVHHSATQTGMLAWLKRHAPKTAMNERAKNPTGRKIKKFVSGNAIATVHYDSEWDEYQVFLSVNGKAKPAATYHTSERDDAIATAKLMAEKANTLPKSNPRGKMRLLHGSAAPKKKKARRKNPTVKGAYWLYLRTGKGWLKLGERSTATLAKRAAQQIANRTGMQVKITLARGRAA